MQDLFVGMLLGFLLGVASTLVMVSGYAEDKAKEVCLQKGGTVYYQGKCLKGEEVK